MATSDPGVPSPEPVPPIIVPPQPADTPPPVVPPDEDGVPPPPPIRLPGQPGAPERVRHAT